MLKRFFVAGSLAVLGAGSAHANITLSYVDTTSAGVGVYDWQYEVDLSPDQIAQIGVVAQGSDVGSYLTLWDFPAYVTSSFTPVAGLMAAVTTPLSLAPQAPNGTSNGALLPNGLEQLSTPGKGITYAVTGPSEINPNNTTTVTLGFLHVFSHLGNNSDAANLDCSGGASTPGCVFYTALAHQDQQGVREPAYNSDWLPSPLPVPEPETYGLMGLGLVGIAALARRKAMAV